jgi:Contractile injection system tube protein
MSLPTAAFEVNGETRATAHFNPASLKVSSTNQIADKSANAHQASAKTATKFDVELIFDTTETGDDVQAAIDPLKAMVMLDKSGNALPKVTFRWGNFAFTGTIESFGETFDFFSPDGVPLRCAVQVAMKGLKLEEAPKRSAAAAPSAGPSSAGPTGATGAAQAAGDPKAGRAIARQNGLESMRQQTAGQLAIPVEAKLEGPAGEAGAAGFSVQPGSGMRFGATAGAGVSASAGAFAGLGGGSADIRIGPLEVKPRAAPSTVVGPDARFDITGKLLGAAITGGRP